jgi:uncharacterized protein
MADDARAVWRRIALYIGLLLLFCAPLYALILGLGQLGGGRGMYVGALMWCPALAALATCRLTGKPVAELGWGWGRTRDQLISWALPLGYAGVAYTAAWATGLAGFYDRAFVGDIQKDFGWEGLPPSVAVLGFVALQGTIGIVRGAAYALGEEIGWRGLLVPELVRVTSFTGAAIISGVVWAVYHAPILLFADYNAGTPWWFGLSCFTVLVMSGSVVFAWMRLRSGSLWTAVLLHASHNVFIQSVFTPLTRPTSTSAYVIDEFGLALPIVLAVLAVILWRRRGELPLPDRLQR